MDATCEREALLLSDYNYWRSHTEYIAEKRKTGYVRDTSMKKARPHLAAMQRWCKDKNIDARRWLYFRFASRHWRYAPPLEQLVPAAKSESKALIAYNLMEATPAYSERIHNEIRYQKDATGITWDVNRDVSHLAEAIKRRYLATHDWQRCIDRMADQTFGYHPKSLVCQRCPGASQCVAQLSRGVPFDIVALRRGDVDLRSCYVAAERGARRECKR